MEVYLVGGAVRDKRLGLAVKERDWVVVGATVQEMLKLGYKQVGKDFPVFLHPKTGEEYALARKERKVGKGYTGFAFDASEQVTLEEDLKRRDLTINAMAETPEGELRDYYDGEKDLEEKILRHVSEAFVEDPVRILRAARFAARFTEFTVAPETNELMKQMVQSGEVNALVPERVWKELEKALTESQPGRFFHVLADCEALPILFPEINAQGLKALTFATPDARIRFAALLHNLNTNDIEKFCERYKIPTEFRELALLTAKFFGAYQQLTEQQTAKGIVILLQNTDAFRRELRFKNFLLACEACCMSEMTHKHCAKPKEILLQCLSETKTVNPKEFSELKGREIAERISQERIKKIALWLENKFN